MIRLNGSPSRDAPLQPLLERAVVEQAGQVVGPGPDLDRLEDLGVLEGDRDLRREQLDELELVGVKVLPTPSRSMVRTPIAPSGRAAGRR